MYCFLQNLASNPELAQQIIGSNPLFAGNPVLQEQLRTMLPTFLNQLQNPEVQSFMTNPQVGKAWKIVTLMNFVRKGILKCHEKFFLLLKS